jgi:hypothetical protein
MLTVINSVGLLHVGAGWRSLVMGRVRPVAHIEYLREHAAMNLPLGKLGQLGTGASSLVIIAAAVGLSTVPVMAHSVMSSVSGDQVASWLRDWGFRADLQLDAVGEPEIRSAASGVPFTIYFTDCDESGQTCATLQFATGVDLTDGATAELVNTWNATKRVGTAYLNADSDPLLRLDLPLEGGVNEDFVNKTVFRWEAALGEFVRFIGAR